MLTLRLNCSTAAHTTSWKFYPTQNWSSLRYLISVIIWELIFPSWHHHGLKKLTPSVLDFSCSVKHSHLPWAPGESPIKLPRMAMFGWNFMCQIDLGKLAVGLVWDESVLTQREVCFDRSRTYTKLGFWWLTITIHIGWNAELLII